MSLGNTSKLPCILLAESSVFLGGGGCMILFLAPKARSFLVNIILVLVLHFSFKIIFQLANKMAK